MIQVHRGSPRVHSHPNIAGPHPACARRVLDQLNNHAELGLYRRVELVLVLELPEARRHPTWSGTRRVLRVGRVGSILCNAPKRCRRRPLARKPHRICRHPA